MTESKLSLLTALVTRWTRSEDIVPFVLLHETISPIFMPSAADDLDCFKLFPADETASFVYERVRQYNIQSIRLAANI